MTTAAEHQGKLRSVGRASSVKHACEFMLVAGAVRAGKQRLPR